MMLNTNTFSVIQPDTVKQQSKAVKLAVDAYLAGRSFCRADKIEFDRDFLTNTRNSMNSLSAQRDDEKLSGNICH